jgi:O-methyltransferase involved in polyketide biosynthesis
MTLNSPGAGAFSDCARLPAFDAGVASPARIWNYWLGGKDNFAADREVAEAVMAVLPAIPAMARATRRFLTQTVHLLAAEHGIRQFLDIGTGLPAAINTHDVAQQAAPESRVVYVDYDPLVLSHARALLPSSPEGRTDYVQADLRDTATIIAQSTRTLDFTRPVAVLLIAVLHYIPDTDDPYTVVRTLMDAVPAASTLAIAHGANDIRPRHVAEAVRLYNAKSAEPLTLRSREEVSRFFDGLEPIGPRVQTPEQWLARHAESSLPALPCYFGVSRKPCGRSNRARAATSPPSGGSTPARAARRSGPGRRGHA